MYLFLCEWCLLLVEIIYCFCVVGICFLGLQVYYVGQWGWVVGCLVYWVGLLFYYLLVIFVNGLVEIMMECLKIWVVLVGKGVFVFVGCVDLVFQKVEWVVVLCGDVEIIVYLKMIEFCDLVYEIVVDWCV